MFVITSLLCMGQIPTPVQAFPSVATETTVLSSSSLSHADKNVFLTNKENNQVSRHAIEADRSYELFLERRLKQDQEIQSQHDQSHRVLKRHRHHHDSDGSSSSRSKTFTAAPAPAPKKKKHHHVPAVQHGTQHGIMIDAGSQGTRIHVYEFEARTLNHVSQIEHAVAGKRLSFPTTNTRWTDRLKPGLDAFAFVPDEADMYNQVKEYLSPLLDFTKLVLESKQSEWSRYPIYLKATGGLRALPRPYRLKLMKVVRKLFADNHTADKDFNPFFFEDEHARVISGEEEAIYGWTAVNFVKGTLIDNSEGTGTVKKPSLTYGVLEMGGASTQIGFFEPHGDVMANLFKLQIGAAKHWNVYCHSFLWFGVNGALSRLNARLYTEHMIQIGHDPTSIVAITSDNGREKTVAAKDGTPITTSTNNTSVDHAITKFDSKGDAIKQQQSKTSSGTTETASSPKSNFQVNDMSNPKIYNPCIPGGGEASYQFTSRVHLFPNNTLLPLSSPDNASVLEAPIYNALMINEYERGDSEACLRQVIKLLRLEANAWCNFAHDRDCSFAGVYQPPLPVGSQYFGEFIATSNFYDVWAFLGYGDPNIRVPLAHVRQKAHTICNMSFPELIAYNNKLPNSPIKSQSDLVQFCFRSMFATAFLIEGVGFAVSANITAVDVLDGQKLGWALGSILYEINTLPWEFAGRTMSHKLSSKLLAAIGMGGNSDDYDGESFFSSVLSSSPMFVNTSFAVFILLVLSVAFKQVAPRQRRFYRTIVEDSKDGNSDPGKDEHLALTAPGSRTNDMTDDKTHGTQNYGTAN